MAIKAASRGRVSPFVVMDVLQAANRRSAEGHDVIHLEVGQPSTGAPGPVIAAAKRAFGGQDLGYTEAFGLPPLRERTAAFYGERYGVPVASGAVAVTTGSSAAFILAFLAAFDAGDRIAFGVPGYPGYRNIATALDLEPVPVPCGEATAFQPNADMLDSLDPVPDGLILASPANPTGAMIDPRDLRDMVQWCREKGVRIVSDEVYHGITFAQDAETLAALEPAAIVVNSFSKYFAMTGWRLGWMVLPEDLRRAAERLTQNLFISPPTLSQHAALHVFDCVETLDANVSRYRENRGLLLDGLRAAGLGPLAPADGAFYIYAGVGDLGAPSPELCRDLLETAGVAATPGTDFDPDRGDGFIRFSYAGSTSDVAEAASRIRRWTEERRA